MNYTKLWLLGVSLSLMMSCAKPVAEFRMAQPEYLAQAEVNFENSSKKAETYSWDFGDGTSSTEATPTHRYEKAGTYTVLLKAEKGGKVSEISQTVKINPLPLSAAFEMQMKGDAAPIEVSFKNKSQSASSYMWDFGDNTKSSEENPVHLYRFSGKYTVKLYAIDGGKRQVAEQEIVIAAGEGSCYVQIETEFGNMKIHLYDETPKHRDNFIKLAEDGFLNDLLFHRVINNFMIQGGDPDSRNARPNVALGMGGTGYTIPAEVEGDLLHYKGALAAARQSDAVNPERASSGSQFYIVHGQPITDAQLSQLEKQKGFKYTPEQRSKYKILGGTPFLDREYTVFGEVVEGLEVIDKIAAAKVDPRSRPVSDIKMQVKVVKE
jgi:cyclophilin family peptidyl-prolyl cis-trans isomerase/chitodextrinase